MIVVRFRSDNDHKDLLHKVKKMKEYAEMLEDCLENAMDDEEPDYRHDWDEYPEHEKEKFYRDMANRYSKMRRMGGKY